jgi:hypothetical protein
MSFKHKSLAIVHSRNSPLDFKIHINADKQLFVFHILNMKIKQPTLSQRAGVFFFQDLCFQKMHFLEST